MKGNHGKKDLADLTMKGVRKNATNILTEHLKRLGSENVSIEDNSATRFEALAKLVWDKALGYREEIKLSNGEIETTIHKPDRGFIGMIFDRTEGRVASVAADDSKGKASLADRIGEQSKVRLNRMAKKND